MPVSEPLIYVGIDTGLTGGIVAVGNSAGSPIITTFVMPTQKARKGNEVDARAVWDWMLSLDFALSSCTFVIEEPGGAKSAAAAVSMAASFHCMRAILAVRNLRTIRITPQSWQRCHIPNCAKGETKSRALTLARECWPRETFLATPRSKVPHPGLVDAALIAHYGRLKAL